MLAWYKCLRQLDVCRADLERTQAFLRGLGPNLQRPARIERDTQPKEGIVMSIQQEQKTRHSLSIWTTLIAIGLTLGSIGETQANNIAVCPNVPVNYDVTLTADISAPVPVPPNYIPKNCIDIDGGHDVNLNGHSITCPVGVACGAGIKASASGTDVTGGNINGSGLTYWGTFAVAIDGATTISNVTLASIQAIKDNSSRLKSITNSYAFCTDTGTSTCVDVTMPRGTDEILNNQFVSEGTGGNGLQIVGATSGAGPTIEGNYVGCDFNNTGIAQVGPTKNIRVYGNTIEGCPTTFNIAHASLVTDINAWSGNVCDDTYYCPPVPTCSNGGVPLCGPGGVYCSPH